MIKKILWDKDLGKKGEVRTCYGHALGYNERGITIIREKGKENG
jgi:hypothetical protein